MVDMEALAHVILRAAKVIAVSNIMVERAKRYSSGETHRKFSEVCVENIENELNPEFVEDCFKNVSHAIQYGEDSDHNES